MVHHYSLPVYSFHKIWKVSTIKVSAPITTIQANIYIKAYNHHKLLALVPRLEIISWIRFPLILQANNTDHINPTEPQPINPKEFPFWEAYKKFTKPSKGNNKNKRLLKNRPKDGAEYIAIDTINITWNASQIKVLENWHRFLHISQPPVNWPKGIRAQQYIDANISRPVSPKEKLSHPSMTTKRENIAK